MSKQNKNKTIYHRVEMKFFALVDGDEVDGDEVEDGWRFVVRHSLCLWHTVAAHTHGPSKLELVEIFLDRIPSYLTHG